MKDSFRRLATRISVWAGTAGVFVGAVIFVLLWAVSGPFAGFSNTWMLIINTATTIMTFLMVFLIQNTQNRDAKAMQLKLDELILADKKARDSFISLEDISDGELAIISQEFQKIHDQIPDAHPMKKLHKKIEAEHAKRRTVREQTGHLMASMLSPITSINHQLRK